MEWRTEDQSASEPPALAATIAVVPPIHFEGTDSHASRRHPLDERWTTLLALAALHGSGRVAYCCVFKRCIDTVVAVLALLALTPVLLVMSVAIWATTGSPIVFRQPRVGRGGKVFAVYKFRTMIPDRRRHSLPHDGIDQRRRHKSARDPRVTRIGRFLRRTSLDEVPQLLNVVRGEMALVGPRPELVEIVARYQPWQHRRHLVRPGLTGWWQVQGRSDRPMHEHTEMDLHYIEHMSPGFDLRIIAKTIRVVVFGSGAF